MKILLLNDREAFDLKALKQITRGHELIVCQAPPENFNLDDILTRHFDAEVIITTYMDLNAKNLARFTQLKAIIATTTATEYIDKNYLKTHHIDLMNTSNYTESAVAEHLFALMMATGRRIPRLNQHLKQGDFEQFEQAGFEFYGKTLGIIGMGSIGQRFAEIAQGLGMNIQYHARTDKSLNFPKVGFEHLLESSDVIALSLPLTKDSYHLIDKKAIERTKKGAILVSISADDLIDLQALTHALEKGHFFGVGLDLHHPQKALEPFENVILTPTKAWYTKECMARRTEVWLTKLDRLINE